VAGVTDIQRANLARQAGFPDNEIARAVAISIAENRSGDPGAEHVNVDGSIDTGLWQINSVHGIPISQLKDPATNAKAAFKVWSDAGNSWRPWSTFNNRSYLMFFQRGQAAAKNKAAPDPGAGVQVSVDPNSSISTVVDAIKFLSDADNWRRVGLFLVGLILIVVAIFKLTGNNQLSPITKGIAKKAVTTAVAA
jgi:hypothetical protein